MSNTSKTEQYKLISRILMVVGFLFLCAGSYFIIAKEHAAELTTLDLELIQILGPAFLFVGFTDFIMGQFFKRRSE